tara:strand:- start:3086 stop:4465 length:1380 start_codon:yes stop_codon:yes gene_type:complete
VVKEKKIGCMIFSVGDEFRKLSECAVNSFKKFHPDVHMHYVDETNIDSFEVNKYVSEEIRNHYGIFRFAIAAEIMGKYKYDKFIFLGADTITCSRLDEFLGIDDVDLLLTSSAPYQVAYPFSFPASDLQLAQAAASDMPATRFFQTIYVPLLYIAANRKDGSIFKDENGNPLIHTYIKNIKEWKIYKKQIEEKTGIIVKVIDYLHANADVICFNSLQALKSVFQCSIRCWQDFHSEDMIHYQLQTGDFEVYPKQDKTMSESLRDAGFDFYADQGGLNILATISILTKIHGWKLGMPDEPWPTLPKHSVLFIDLPFMFTPDLYNVRSKKSIDEWTEETMTGEPRSHPKSHPSQAADNGQSIGDFYVKDNKLFTIENKQIKVWHYSAGLGLNTKVQNLGKVNKINKEDIQKATDDEILEAKKLFCDKVNSYTLGMFNQETRDFFTNQCDCGDFFQKEFELE